MSDQSDSETPRGTLGVFGGVFTPSILTILGIILFLRLGYVIGNIGLGRSIMIIGLANLISVLTTFSLSAISTNLRVKRGGDYYLISRTLGVEFGGAIGVVLFLAQSISIGFYCIGFGEVLTNILPFTVNHLNQIIAATAVLFLFIFAWLGADWATKLQYVIMSILGLALVSFFTGGFGAWDSGLLVQNWKPLSGSPDFWILFAIFFPAVTGFTQGVSMSGDLKDPGRSLPLGTFLAVGLSIIVYFAVAVLFSATVPAQTLSTDYLAMKRVAAFSPLIDAGVISATLSSAMASFLGAPRILQSMASDRIMPVLLPFAQGSGPSDNPRRGVLLSGAIAFATISLGKLNIIAPVVSMFFLISYGLLNYATFYEARAASPSFRPRFRFYDYRLSLIGFLACLGVMLAIDLTAGIIGLAVLFGIYQYLKRTAGPARWADSRRSYHLQRLRDHLLAADQEPEHPRDWRPQLLVFSNQPGRRESLLRFASWLSGGSGLTTVVKLVVGEGLKMLRVRSDAENELKADIRKFEIDAFPLVLISSDIKSGVQALVQAYGIGPVRVNTVLLNWLEDPENGMPGLKEMIYGSNLRAAFRFGCNIVILNTPAEGWGSTASNSSEPKRIDVWWFDDPSSRLILLLAHLMTRHEQWNEARIRVLALCEKLDADALSESLNQFLSDARISAESEIITEPGNGVIAKHSSDAAFVFLPFRIQSNKILDPLGNSVESLMEVLPANALVLAAEDIELDAEPEEGAAAETAAVLDTLSDAQKKAREAEEKAKKLASEAEEKIHEMEEAVSSGEDEDEAKKVALEAEKAQKEAEKAARKAAKAEAKAEVAVKEAETIGIELGENNQEKKKTEEHEP